MNLEPLDHELRQLGEPNPARVESVRQMLETRWSAVRPMPSARTLTLLLTFVFLLVCGGMTSWLGDYAVHALTPVRAVIYYLPLLICAVLTISVWVRTLAPGARTRIRPAAAIWATFAIACVVVILLFPSLSTRFFLAGRRCFINGCLTAAVATLPLALLAVRGMAAAPVRAGMLGGFIAGFAGFSVLSLHCPVFTIPHIMVWHLGVVAPSTLVGAAIGYAVSKKSERPRNS